MTSKESTGQKDLFSVPMAKNSFGPPIVLELKGIVIPFQKDHTTHYLRGIPTFKNSKRVMAWLDKAKKLVTFMNGFYWVRQDTIRIQNTLMTLPQHQKWMDQAILSIESRLRSVLQITDKKIQTVASARSWIASKVPLDDSWTWCPEIVLKSEKCEEGEEGATIVITRLR